MFSYENLAIGNSFEEIVFNNRNKNYGAYMLRKNQKGYLIIGFGIAFLLVVSSVMGPYVYNLGKKPPVANTNDFGTVGVILDSTIQVVPPEPPEVKVERVIFNVDILVVDTVDESSQFLATIDDLVENTENLNPPDIITAEAKTDGVIEIEEKPFVKVEIEAQFQGGNINNFNKWVASRIIYPKVCEENGITGKVYVQFVVNQAGQVEDVKVMRGADPAMNEEALRVIKSSPEWTAPIQGGRNVKQLFTLPVIFQINPME